MNIQELNRKEYEAEVMSDAIEMCKQMEEYDGAYVCDGMADVANENISLSDGYSNFAELAEWMEEAVAQGLVDMKNFTIDNLIQAGMFEYYTQELYNNQSAIAFNVMLAYLQANAVDIDLTDADEDEVVSLMEELAEAFDYNNGWQDLNNELFDRLKDIEDVTFNS